jgi:chromosome segregation ATPase
LAKFAGRFALGVADMIQMIEHFPKQEAWKSGRLDILRDETAKLIARKPRIDKGGTHAGPVSRREHEALQEKLAAARAEIRQLREENEQLRKRIATLESKRQKAAA